MRTIGLGCVLAAAALWGCGGGSGKGSGKGPEWNVVDCGAGGYSFKSPYWNGDIGWFVQEAGTTSYTISNNNQDIDCAVEVNPLAEGQASLDDYVKADLDARKKNKGFEVVAELQAVTVSGKQGKRVTYKMKSHLWKNDGDGTQMETITYVLKGKNVISVRTSCRTDYWDKRKGYFVDLHKSLTLK
jgi:hypothetical protein